MGAVQKLATVVIVGLVALATVLTVYIAREPERRDSELTEQEQIAIQRGTDLYIQYCLQCHGPAGLGNSDIANESPARIGQPLNKEGAGIPEDPAETFINFQSDNPADVAAAEEFIDFRLQHGAPADPRLNKTMPSFGTELNGEQIEDLIFMIMNADWDYVYNQAVQQTGETAAQAECDENEGEGEYCDHIEEAPPLYPTPPPQDAPETGGGGGGTPAAEGSNEGAPTGGEAAVTVEALDPPGWSQTEITAQPGDTIAVVPSGGLQHDFVIDEFGIAEDLPPGGETVMVTIPEDAEPGEYVFYCSVPGHREAGMEGTLTIEAP